MSRLPFSGRRHSILSREEEATELFLDDQQATRRSTLFKPLFKPLSLFFLFCFCLLLKKKHRWTNCSWQSTTTFEVQIIESKNSKAENVKSDKFRVYPPRFPPSFRGQTPKSVVRTELIDRSVVPRPFVNNFNLPLARGNFLFGLLRWKWGAETKEDR